MIQRPGGFRRHGGCKRRRASCSRAGLGLPTILARLAHRSTGEDITYVFFKLFGWETLASWGQLGDAGWKPLAYTLPTGAWCLRWRRFDFITERVRKTARPAAGGL